MPIKIDYQRCCFKNKKTLYTILIVCFLYLLIAIIYNWNLLEHFSSSIPGNSAYTDAPNFLWNLWWVKKAILSGENPLYTRFIFYPQQINLSYYTLTILLGFFSIVLQKIFSLVVIYNLFYILSFVVAGLGTFLLSFFLTKNKIASFVAGLIFAFTPYIFGHIYLGHLNLVNTWVIPFFIWSLFRFYQKRNIWNLFLVILFLTFQTYLDFYYLFLILIFILAFLVWKGISEPQKFFNKDFIVKMLIIFGIWLVLSTPIFFAIHQANTNLNLATSTFSNNTDLRNYFSPNPFNPWIGKNQLEFAKNIAYGLGENTVNLGYIAVVLAVLAIFVSKRKGRFFWFGVFIIFFILSLGPKLQINGQVYFSLPDISLQSLPIFNTGLVPSRFVIMSILSLGILSAYFIDCLRRRFNILAIITMVLIVLEFYPGKLTINPIPSPSFFQQIAKDKDDYTIIDFNIGLNPRLMYYQTIHQKPILMGWIGRRISYNYADFYKKISGINYLYPYYPFETGGVVGGVSKTEMMTELKNLKVKYIVLDKTVAGEELNQWIDYFGNNLGLPKKYEDDFIIVYQTN